MNWIERELKNEITALSAYFQVITITGPRQSGKTTLCRNLFPEYAYVNLEDVEIRERIQRDTKSFLEHYPEGLIIDEAHHYPDLFSYVQVYVDNHPERKFILTGSSHFSLLQNITQSLAGRTAVLNLLPLSLHELGDRVNETDTDTLLLRGGYPAVWAKGIPPDKLYQNYYTTYIEKDVRQLVHIKDIQLYQKFIRLAAGRIASEYNASALAGEVGTSVPTINSWFSTLATSYIAYTLPPYYENIRKRLTKTPKLYFYDTGVACHLLGIENEAQLRNHPLRGNLFENMVVNEAIKSRFNRGKQSNLYFFRNKSGKEVDLLYSISDRFHAYEIKSAQTFHTDFTKGLDYVKKLFGERILHSGVIYDGQTQGDDIMNFRDFKLFP